MLESERQIFIRNAKIVKESSVDRKHWSVSNNNDNNNQSRNDRQLKTISMVIKTAVIRYGTQNCPRPGNFIIPPVVFHLFAYRAAAAAAAAKGQCSFARIHIIHFVIISVK